MPENFEMGPQGNSSNSAKEETRDTDNLSEPRPVEEIIPGIQGDINAEKNIQERSKWGDNAFETDFWKSLVKRYINPESYKKFVEESRADGSMVFQDDAPEVFELPDFIKYNNEDEQRAMKLFEGQIVIDLGAGFSPNGNLLSQELRAKAYVGVEPFFYEGLKRIAKNMDSKGGSLKKPSSNPSEIYDERKYLASLPGFYKHRIPYSIVKNDMLTFLRRLPDDSVSIIMGGIDSSIIRDPEYMKQVTQEIERVLSPQGAFLSHCSGIETPDKLDIVYSEGSGASEDNIDYQWEKFVFKKRLKENSGEGTQEI